MNIPYNKKHTMMMYETDTIQFQLTENGEPVADDLSTQDINFFIRNHDNDWQNIEKDIVSEGWVVNNTTKVFKIVINTQSYLMCDTNDTVKYRCRVEWNDKKYILADFEVEVLYVDLWSDD